VTANHPAIACSLTDAALRERRAEVRSALRNATVEETSELPDGYLLRFALEPGLIERIAKFVALESDCCPFLRFAIEVGDNHGPVSLRLTGPAGAKEFLRGMLTER
jgi:hypothetical protein